MRKKEKQTKKLIRLVEKKSGRGILPFTERPSEEETKTTDRSRLAASDLFSLYTADIIKEEKLFIR